MPSSVKSRTSRRDLPLVEVLVKMLRKYRLRWVPNEPGYFFANRKGGPIGAQYVRRKVLHPIRERLGIPRGAFHAFRHGHATIIFSEGANAKQWLPDLLYTPTSTHNCNPCD